MNYWPACSTNLNECVWPLIDFIRTLVKPGEKTAQAYFGARDGQLHLRKHFRIHLPFDR